VNNGVGDALIFLSRCLPNGACLYITSHKLNNMSSYDSLNARLKELTGQLDQKDTELDQEVDDIIETDLDELDESIEGTEKDLEEGLRKRVEAVKMGIKDRKDRLRERVEAAKRAPKDRARKEADDALNSMEEDLSKGDLVAAHIDRWVAHQWLKASK
jgi:hypothetical protein